MEPAQMTLPDILENQPKIFARKIDLTVPRLNSDLATRMKAGDARWIGGEDAYKPVLYGIIFANERLYAFTGRFTAQFEEPLHRLGEGVPDNRPRGRQIPSNLTPYECWVMLPAIPNRIADSVCSLIDYRLSTSDITVIFSGSKLTRIFPEKPAILENLGTLVVEINPPTSTPLPTLPKRPQGYTEQWYAN